MSTSSSDSHKRSIAKLNSDTLRKPFDCGNADLNDFFHNDSKDHSNQLLAITYALETTDQTIAFFSVLNDSIKIEYASKKAFNKLVRPLPNTKRYKSQPSVKIGRLAVSLPFQRKSIGSQLMDLLKGFSL